MLIDIIHSKNTDLRINPEPIRIIENSDSGSRVGNGSLQYQLKIPAKFFIIKISIKKVNPSSAISM